MLSYQRRFQFGWVLTLLSGAAALSHQLLWTNRMTDLLGASAESTTRVFSCFFLGLSVGAGLMGWRVSKISRPWRWLAFAEFAVALLCLPVLLLSHWTDWIWPWLGVDGLTGWQGSGLKWLLSMVVVFLPALGMGTTLPVLIKGVHGNSRREDVSSVWLYSLNTLGGLIGLGVTGCLTLYLFGVSGAMILAIVINALVGMCAFWMDKQSQPVEAKVNKGSSDKGLLSLYKRLGWQITLTAFASGFLVLGLEILAMDLVMLVAPLSFHAPVAVLGSFIFALAVSALLVSIFGNRSGRSSQWIVWVLLLTAGLTAIGPVLFVQTAMHAEGMQSADSLVGFTRSLVFLVLLSFGPGILLGGLIFPYLLRMIPNDCDNSGAVGFLLAVNGLGGLLGAEFAYLILMPMLGVYAGIGVVALIYAFLAFCWGTWNRKTIASFQSALPFTATILVCGSFLWLKQLPVVNPNMGLNLLQLEFGREGNLAVVEHENFGRGLLFSNQYLLGSTNVRFDQERQAHIPLLLHEQPKKVCFIGLATGITPSAAFQHSTVEKIDVVELSSMVVRAAGNHFSDYNAQIIDAPSAEITVEDGRTFIAAQQEAYDVIVSDLFLPWRPGVGRLYSVEHFQAAKKALRPGGIYCHWLPLYQFSESQLEMVVRTFQNAFPTMHLFEGKLQLDSPVLGLVGFNDGSLDWKIVQQACYRERQAGNIKDPTVRHFQGLALLYRGSISQEGGHHDMNTLNNMKLELEAGLDRMMDPNGKKYLAGPNWLNLVQKYVQKNHFDGADQVMKTMALQGLKISVLGEKIKQEGKSSNALLKQVFAQIPEAMIKDRQSDWKRWAGREVNVRWKPATNSE